MVIHEVTLNPLSRDWRIHWGTRDDVIFFIPVSRSRLLLFMSWRWILSVAIGASVDAHDDIMFLIPVSRAGYGYSWVDAESS